jgi:hypothetical protein
MTEEKKVALKNQIAVALRDELGRVPTPEEVEKMSQFARVLFKAVLGTHFERRQQKQSGQVRMF